MRDVDADGLDDLVCEIDERALMGGAIEKVVTLEGRTRTAEVERCRDIQRVERTRLRKV